MVSSRPMMARYFTVMGQKLFVSSIRGLIGAEKGFSVKENFHRIASKKHTEKGRTTDGHGEGTADDADSRRRMQGMRSLSQIRLIFLP